MQSGLGAGVFVGGIMIGVLHPRGAVAGAILVILTHLLQCIS